jgi:hypothetical protein
MSKSKKPLKQQLGSILLRLTNSRVLVMILVIGSTVGYMSYRIQKIISLEPDSEVVSTRISELKGKPLDISSLDIIEQLNARNITLESIFDDTRNNPFEKR